MMDQPPSRRAYLPLGKNPHLKSTACCEWPSCTNVLLGSIFLVLLIFGGVVLDEGLKTKPVATEMMARFVGISETVKKGDNLLDNDMLARLGDMALYWFNNPPISQATFDRLCHQTSILIQSFSEEEIVQVKNNVVRFTDVLGRIDKDKVEALINAFDVQALNRLINTTSAIEQRLRDLHEIKVSL